MGRILISISLAGSLMVGLLLFTGHWGFAIKASGYLFFGIFAGTLYEKFS